MRILYDNVFKSAALSATNENANYPVTNAVHRFMHKRFESTTTSAVVTATLNSDATVNCFFMGYHNVTSGSLVLKNSAGSTLSTITITAPTGIDPYVIYFTEQTTVRSMVLTLGSTTDNLYVGCFACGDYLLMPGFSPETSFGQAVNSSITETLEGYVSGFNRSVLKSPSFTFPVCSQTEKEYIETMVNAVGGAIPIWLDTYESDNTFAPLYCRISAAEGYKKNAQAGITYSVAMTFKECR
jgi:hypothetical protein